MPIPRGQGGQYLPADGGAVGVADLLDQLLILGMQHDAYARHGQQSRPTGPWRSLPARLHPGCG